MVVAVLVLQTSAHAHKHEQMRNFQSITWHSYAFVSNLENNKRIQEPVVHFK